MALSQDSPKPGSPGSIGDISGRLALWARRDSSGLVRVEYSSEFARQRVMQQLQSLLTAQGISLEEIALPTFQDAEAVVQTLITCLEEAAAQPVAVVSVTGFATAFSQESSLDDALRVLNFNRDRYVSLPLRQIWWMTPVFTQNAIQAMPDLNSFFLQRLQLIEVILPEADFQKLVDINGSTTNIDDARQRAYGLIRQFEIAKTSEASPADLLNTYILPALEALTEVGAQKELRDLTQQFEGILVQLKVTDSIELASSLGRLANLYTVQGRYGEAEPLYQQSLALYQRLLGNDRPDVAMGMNNLAYLYKLQGRYSEAEPLYRDALTLNQRLLGDDHLAVATSMNNLASLYESQGCHGEAEPLYRDALTLRQRLLGNDHPDVASSMNNLAGLYKLQGRYSEAEPLAIQALHIGLSVLGQDHPDIGVWLGNLASLRVAQGNFAAVESMFLQALSIFVNSVGAEHPYTTEVFNRLGNFVAAVQSAGQAHILSDHPLTQELLRQVQGQPSTP